MSAPGHDTPGSGGSSDLSDGPPSSPPAHDDEHRTAQAVLGFFVGVLGVFVVPVVVGTVLSSIFDTGTAADLVWVMLLPLLVPIALLRPARTRRFAAFVLVGAVVTVLVVGGVFMLMLMLFMNLYG